MLTLLGSLLGFATSAIPDIMALFRERADRKHELAVLDRQMEQMRLGHTQRLEEIEVNADIAESKALYQHDAALGGSSRWVDGLRASVRPLITYAFFLLFASVKGSGLYLLIVVEGLLIAEARRHPHRRAQSAPPCGVSCGPRAYRVRVPIQIDRYRSCGERTSCSAVSDPIDAAAAISPWRHRASTAMQGRERQSDEGERIVRPPK